LFRIHRITLRRWVKAGRIKAYALPGRITRFDAGEASALVWQIDFDRRPGPKPKPAIATPAPSNSHTPASPTQ
jgi:hypothetical protein